MRLTLISIVLVSSVFVQSFGSSMRSSRLLNEPSSWKDKQVLDSIVDKDVRKIDQIYGAVTTLETLKSNLSADTYTRQMKAKRDELSEYLGYHVQTDQEMHEILDFFAAQKGISTADKVKAMFTFANILLILGIVVTVIAFGSVATIWILPLIVNLPTPVKLAMSYVLSAAVMASAYVTPSNFANYVGFLGALCFGGAYVYHLSTMEHHKEIPVVIFLPPLLVWSILAITLQTRLIGFITVMDFAALLGFGFWIGPLCTAIGFDDEKQAMRALFPSGMLILLYIANALGAFKSIAYYMNPFDAGVFFVGTFVYFTALLILSSRFYRENYTCCLNVMAVFSILGVAALGFLLPSLAVFRGVGLTFSMIYLLQKYIEIHWGQYWSCGLLGGGLIVIGICFLIKQYGTYFVFWNY